MLDICERTRLPRSNGRRPLEPQQGGGTVGGTVAGGGALGDVDRTIFEGGPGTILMRVLTDGKLPPICAAVRNSPVIGKQSAWM
eukprot:gene6955-biopygen2000